MKSTMKILLISALTLLISTGCSNSGSTRESYFGYNNNPKFEEESENRLTEKVDNQWVNPLGNNKNQVSNYNDVVYQTNGLRYQEPMYIPVIVPWWSSYYGWMSPYNNRRFYSNSYYDSYGYCGYDWYSPWYEYHPYYGGYYYDWYRPHRSWYNYNSYTDNHDRPEKKESYRNFGASRGTYSDPGRGSAVSNSPRGSVVNSENSNSNRTVNTVRQNNDSPSKNVNNTDSQRGKRYVAPEADRSNNTNYRPTGNDNPSRRSNNNNGTVRGSDNRNSDSPRNNTPSYTPPARSNEPTTKPSNDSGRGSSKSDDSKSGSNTNSPRRTR